MGHNKSKHLHNVQPFKSKHHSMCFFFFVEGWLLTKRRVERKWDSMSHPILITSHLFKIIFILIPLKKTKRLPKKKSKPH